MCTYFFMYLCVYVCLYALASFNLFIFVYVYRYIFCFYLSTSDIIFIFLLPGYFLLALANYHVFSNRTFFRRKWVSPLSVCMSASELMINKSMCTCVYMGEHVFAPRECMCTSSLVRVYTRKSLYVCAGSEAAPCPYPCPADAPGHARMIGRQREEAGIVINIPIITQHSPPYIRWTNAFVMTRSVCMQYANRWPIPGGNCEKRRLKWACNNTVGDVPDTTAFKLP